MNHDDARRDELRDKIEKSQGSLTAVTVPDAEPPEGYVDLAMDYPLAAIGGGLAIGLLAGAMLPRGIGRKLAKGTVSAALFAGKMGLDYGASAIDIVGDASGPALAKGREKISEIGESSVRYGKKAVAATREIMPEKHKIDWASGYSLVGKVIKFVTSRRH